MARSSASLHILARILREGRRPCDHTLLGSETLRAALGGILALTVILVAVRVPWSGGQQYLGWSTTPYQERIQLQQTPKELVERSEIQGGPITRFDQPPAEDSVPETPAEVHGAEPEPVIAEPASRVVSMERLTQRPILEFADQSPQIVGGLGSLYLNIMYPPEALKDNAQGRNIIEFVVEEDGSTSQIRVLQPLHPACDSVAVQAIRHTKFVPGRQNGELVRVKMRLPIRFRLLQEGQPVDSSQVNL